MAVQRWRFSDGQGDVWTMPRNPSSMSPITPERQITVQGTTAVDGRTLLFEGRAAPRPFTFQGKIYTYSDYNNLRKWVYDKVQRIIIRDHFGRNLTVVLQKMDATPRTKYNKYWHHEYEVTGLVLAVGNPTVGV